MGRDVCHLVDALVCCFDLHVSFATDALLEHLATHHSVPSIDNYKDLLPKRSCFEFDLAMLSKFSDAPSLLP
ncbi:hypothetical protein T484DRAFT_1761712, partial [Baffinella frigidus]